MIQEDIKPFLKWAGGKRWFVNYQKHLLPEKHNKYFEPFLGSGALFFSMNHIDGGIISDTNKWLIDAYLAIQSDPQQVKQKLIIHKSNHCNEYYYSIRNKNYRSIYSRAAQLIYLNRTCWNGLFRVNKSGEFNVPIGDRVSIVYNHDDFELISKKLKPFKILHQDFSITTSKARKNDFIYIDPPYTVKHDYNGFIKYNEKLFSWDDQIRLRDCVESALSRGVKILISNANHDSILDLYSGLGEIITLSRNNMLASNKAYRGKYAEIAIKCGY